MVYILLADGFEDMEALTPLDVLRRANIDARLVSLAGTTVTSSHALTVTVDGLINGVSLPDCDMLVLPGGPGVETLKASQPVLDLLTQANEQGKLVAAICAAPAILAELGLLRGRRAVSHPSCHEVLRKHGAHILEDTTVTHDQHIITANAAGASLDFALKLVSMLKGWAAAEAVRSEIYYQPNLRALT